MPIELVHAPPADLFPGWCAVAQMGHVCHRGYATIDTQLGIPMIRVVLPAVDGDEAHEAIAEQVVLVAPGSLYGVTPTSEAAAVEHRRAMRPWKEQARRPLALPDTDTDDDPVAELAPPAPASSCGHPASQDCDVCNPPF